MRDALSIPLAGRGPRTEGRRVLSVFNQRGLVNAVLAWAITYGGVLLGSALLGTIDNRAIAALVVELSFFIVPVAVVSAVSLWAFILPNAA